MSQKVMPTGMVGNDIFVPRPRLQMAGTPVSYAPKTEIVSIPIMPVADDFSHTVAVRTAPALPSFAAPRPATATNRRFTRRHRALDFVHQYSIGAFALLFLLVGSTGTQVYANYRSTQITASVPQTHINRSIIHTGLNTAVPASLTVPTVQKITGQPVSLDIAGQTDTLGSDTIKGWLQIVTDQPTHTSYIHVNEQAISASLQAVAQKYSKAAVNQVSAVHDNVTSVIATGKNGMQVTVPSDLAKSIARNLLEAKGFQAPLNASPLAFQAVTPAAFSKLIEVNLDTKQMWLYQNGQLYKTYLVSAGKPSTPTPVGQYKIFAKYASQDMYGYGPNGAYYFQPHVHWINYFLPGGFAVHGVYWHPLSWFGAINSSHGCVGVPDAQAKEIYDWAPIGTTVITHM